REGILGSPGPAAHRAVRPVRPSSGRLRDLVPAVVSLADELLLRELLEQRVDRAGGRTPPAHRHSIHLLHDLRSVHRSSFEKLKHPDPETSMPFRTPTVSPHARNSDIAYSI